MPQKQTDLDKVRGEYVTQIMEAAARVNEPDFNARYLIDALVMEWGLKAYCDGRRHMAERIRKCADDWMKATG